MIPKLTPEELKQMRKLMGFWSRRELAEVLNISTRTVDSWEQGVRPIPGWLRVALWGASIFSRLGEGYRDGKAYKVTELPSILGVTEETISEAISLGTLPVSSKSGSMEVNYQDLINYYFSLQSREGRIHVAMDRLILLGEHDNREDFELSAESYKILISLGCPFFGGGVLPRVSKDAVRKVEGSISWRIDRAINLLQLTAPEVVLGFGIKSQAMIYKEARERLALRLARLMLFSYLGEGQVEPEQERVVQSILLKVEMDSVFGTMLQMFSARLKELFQLLDAVARPAPGSLSPFSDSFTLITVRNILHYNIFQAMWDQKPAPMSLENLHKIEDLAFQRLAGRLSEKLWKFLEKSQS